jgi:hypothetical protein
VLRESLVVIAHGFESQGEVAVSAGVARIQLEGGIQFLARLLEEVLEVVKPAEKEVGVGVPRVQFDGQEERFLGFVIVLEKVVAEAEQFCGARLAGVALKRSLELDGSFRGFLPDEEIGAAAEVIVIVASLGAGGRAEQDGGKKKEALDPHDAAGFIL